jgi:hypothetical protein
MNAQQRSVRKNRKHQLERTAASRYRPQILWRPRGDGEHFASSALE